MLPAQLGSPVLTSAALAIIFGKWGTSFVQNAFSDISNCASFSDAMGHALANSIIQTINYFTTNELPFEKVKENMQDDFVTAVTEDEGLKKELPTFAQKIDLLNKMFDYLKAGIDGYNSNPKGFRNCDGTEELPKLDNFTSPILLSVVASHDPNEKVGPTGYGQMVIFRILLRFLIGFSLQ